MTDHKTGTREEWLAARLELLEAEKEVGGEVKEHRFVRAETHSSREEAIAFSIAKAKQIVDEQGDRIRKLDQSAINIGGPPGQGGPPQFCRAIIQAAGMRQSATSLLPSGSRR